MGADLVGAHFPTNAALDSIFGQARNAAQSNQPLYTNLSYTGINGLVDTAAALVTQVMTVVAIPIDIGVEVSKISVLVGATAGSTMTNQWAALYSGTSVAAPTLIGQSTDGTSGAIAAAGRFDFTLTNPYVVGSKSTDAPNGYIYAAIMVKGTTVPSLITQATGAVAAQYAWFPNSPPFFSESSGSSLTATAPATLIAASTKTVAPVVFLS